jgi:hypothetical protein
VAEVVGGDPSAVSLLCSVRLPRPFRRSVPQNPAILGTAMISSETRMQIRHCFFAEHWKIGTISKELGIHPDAVRSAIESNHFHRAQTLRACITYLYLPFIRQTLDQYP